MSLLMMFRPTWDHIKILARPKVKKRKGQIVSYMDGPTGPVPVFSRDRKWDDEEVLGAYMVHCYMRYYGLLG